MRPASRSGGAPMRGVGGGMVQPSMAANGMRPPTGSRNTGNAPELKTDVVIEHRPVTNHGIRGMDVKPMGPSRQIADKSYYLIELRQKYQDITSEIANMVAETRKMESDNALHAQYSRKYETMVKEVRLKEGQLADFNLALDKVRTHTDVLEIQDFFQRLRMRNDQDRALVDETFLRVADADKALKEIEERIQDLHDKAGERISSLGEDIQEEYANLQDEEIMLNQEIGKKEHVVMELENRLGHAQQELKSDTYRIHAKGLELQKTQRMLLKERQRLDDEANSDLNWDALKEKLKEQILETNKEVADGETRIKKLQKRLGDGQDEVMKKEQEILHAKSSAAQAHKYESLHSRGKIIQEFVDSFPENLQVEKENKEKLQKTIVLLLKHISKQIIQKDQVPQNASKFKEMKEELSFKQQTQQHSENTMASLEKEHTKRKAELEKILSLDKKVVTEMKQLTDRIAEMKADMSTFKSADDQRIQHAQIKAHLLQKDAAGKKEVEALKQQVQVISHSFDNIKRDLAANPHMKTLVALERKLSTYAQTVHTLSDYIKTRKRESDYDGLLKDVLACTGELNQLHISNVGARKMPSR